MQYEDGGRDTALVAELRHHSVQVGETPAGEPYLEVADACQPPRLHDAGLGAKARLKAIRVHADRHPHPDQCVHCASIFCPPGIVFHAGTGTGRLVVIRPGSRSGAARWVGGSRWRLAITPSNSGVGSRRCSMGTGGSGGFGLAGCGSRYGGGWSVGVEYASVGCGGGGGSVGVAGDFPAPAVDDDDVVIAAEHCQVAQGGGAAVGPGDEVVDLADRRGLLAAGEPAVLVPLGDGFAQVRGDEAGGAAEAGGLGQAGEAGGQQVAAQVGGESGGPGQQVDAPLQQGVLEPFAGLAGELGEGPAGAAVGALPVPASGRNQPVYAVPGRGRACPILLPAPR